jgi:hypothetical protein
MTVMAIIMMITALNYGYLSARGAYILRVSHQIFTRKLQFCVVCFPSGCQAVPASKNSRPAGTGFTKFDTGDFNHETVNSVRSESEQRNGQ